MTRESPAESVLVGVLRANERRDPKRVRLKLKRMAESAFAFFRGSCEIFAHDWAELRPRDPGPPLLACGDLHLENFGAYRDDEGEFLFDVNDFDESHVGPCSVDPVRCATSILLAAELWALSPLHANRLVLAYLDEYRAAVTTAPHARRADFAAPRLSRGPIWEILGKTALGTQTELLDRNTERTKNGTRRIARSKKKHPPVSDDLRDEVLAAVETYGHSKERPEFYHPLDVTGRIAGIGSLGVNRYAVLVAGGGSAETNRLLDIKEELPSAWESSSGSTAPAAAVSQAARVVHAQRTLTARPPAGLDVISIGGADYRVRELIPEENRSSLDRFQRKPAKLYQAIVEAGRLTGLAHLRSAVAVEGHDDSGTLADWVNGPAVDSLLAAASRYAERNRLAFKQFRADLKAPDALPGSLKDRFNK